MSENNKQYVFHNGDWYDVVRIWCDGRQYDPESEGYRPIYSYEIKTKQWSYSSNDIIGAINEIPDLHAASQSLFAFLFMCCVDDSSESDKQMFPDHVRIWGEQFVREFMVLSQEAAKVVSAAVQVPEPEEMSAEEIFGEDE